jgi:hypothetical protein
MQLSLCRFSSVDSQKKFSSMSLVCPALFIMAKAGRKTRSSLARSARGWLGSARLGSLW